MSHLLLVLCLLLTGCSRSVDSCRRDAEATQVAMQRLLTDVHSKEELRLHLPKIRRLYRELAQLMIAADQAYDRDECIATPSDASAQLCLELTRIYRLEGCAALMEEAQEGALCLLGKRLGPTYDSEGSVFWL